MTLKDFVSKLFNYRIKNGELGWNEMAESLGPSGVWSLNGSPQKFQEIILELLKRVDKLENPPKS